MTSAPPGWYPDTTAPPTTPTLRWWDGTQWTAHLAPAVAPAPMAAPVAPTTPDGVPVAGWGRRLVAYLIDSLFTGIVGLVATLWLVISLWRSTLDLFDALDEETLELPPGVSFYSFYDNFWAMVIGVFVIGFGSALAYHVFFLRWWGTTPGKRFLKLTVRRWEAAGGLDWPTVLKRAGTQYGVFALLSVAYVNVLDGLWPLWDERRQALHDKVAGTVVVDVSRDDGQW